MSNLSTRPIMIVAGGTGGHMFPGAALARTLCLRGYRVVFVSDARGAAVSRKNLGLPPEIERYAVSAGRLGGNLFATGRGILALIKGFTEARRLVRRLQPSLAVGLAAIPRYRRSWRRACPVCRPSFTNKTPFLGAPIDAWRAARGLSRCRSSAPQN